MGQEIIANGTDIVYELLPCYEVVNFSYVLERSPSTQCILIFASLGLFSFLTVCGNVLVIISVAYFKQLHTPTNFLVLSLAVADLLVGLVVVPLNAVFNVTYCIYTVLLPCKVRDCFGVGTSTSSILHLCLIAIDRHVAVCNPLTYSAKMNNGVALAMILLSWSVSSAVGIIMTAAGSNHAKCEGDCSVAILISNVLSTIFAFYLPALIMIVIYLKIFFVAQKQARSIQGYKSEATAGKNEKKATKTLAIVMGAFLLCMCPYFLFVAFRPLVSGEPSLAVVQTLIWVALINSMLNPFIYGFFYSWYRSAFKIIITGQIFQGDFTNKILN